MNCIKFISKLFAPKEFAPKESQIPYYQVLSMDPRKTTTQQRKKARLKMKQQHFNTYNNERARRCIEPITYDEYNKMLKLEELHYEKDKERSENYHMSCFDKKKNNNQKELLLKKIYSPTDEFAEMNRMNRKQRMALEAQNNYKVNMRNFQTHLESEQGQRDLERLTIVKKRREEARLKREAEGRAPGWTPNGVASSSDDDKPIANNPNLVKKTGEKMKKVRFCSMDGPTDEFAGMNREAVEAQRKYTEYMRRTAADKTDKGRRDFERLTYIRKKRELAPGWTLYEIDSDVSDIDSDVAVIDSDVSDDEIKESKLFNKNSSTLIQNIPNYSENTILFEKNEDNTNLVILDNKIRYYCNICNKKYFSKSSLWNHNKKFHTDYYRL